MAVGDEPGYQIDREVGRTPMARMLNLEQVLELVKHRFHQGPSAKNDFFVQQQQAVGHIPLEVGHQPHPPGLEQGTGQRL